MGLIYNFSRKNGLDSIRVVRKKFKNYFKIYIQKFEFDWLEVCLFIFKCYNEMIMYIMLLFCQVYIRKVDL